MYKKDLQICNGLIYLDDKTRSLLLILNMFVCMYLFAIDKNSVKIVHSLIVQAKKLNK